MRKLTLTALLLIAPMLAPLARADDVSVDIHLGSYPRLVAVPGYPVYYDPYIRANYFFYDGLYWVYSGDNWYESHWYNGPWHYARPDYVPLYVLRVPVRYYRVPPPYFAHWRRDEPPRWDEHWGHDWQAHHDGWNHWDHHATPAPAPLPDYQRHYAGAHYPVAEVDQHTLRQQNYHYEPREEATRERWQEQESKKEQRHEDEYSQHQQHREGHDEHGDQ